MPAIIDPAWLLDLKSYFDGLGVPVMVWLPRVYTESNFWPGAVNDTLNRTDLPAGTVPEYSVGLFQINLKARFPNLSDAELRAKGEEFKDPLTNAKAIGPAIAAAWHAVKNQLENEPVTSWASVVGVRSGAPGGNVNHPCVSDWCKRYMVILENMSKKVYTALQIASIGNGIVGAIRGAPAGTTPVPAAQPGSGSGSGSGSASTTGAAGAVGYAGGAVSDSASAGASAADRAAQSTAGVIRAIGEFSSGLDWLQITLFVAGVLLVLLSLSSVIFEASKPAIKAAARVADNPATAAAEAVGA